MKKSHRLFWGVFVVMLISICLFASRCKFARSDDDIIPMLRKELQLDADQDTTISFIAEYEICDKSLLWFSVQGQHMTTYRAVECNKTSGGNYFVKRIYKPMTYAQDIVHVIFESEDVFLINNISCQSVIYRNNSGDVISHTDISPCDIPYVFILKPTVNESICDFIDAKGNVIR